MTLRERTKETICHGLGMVVAITCYYLHKGSFLLPSEPPRQDMTLTILCVGAMIGLGHYLVFFMRLLTKPNP